jgi:16S rRNA (uracil1498-N3)-methyltransferase
VRLPRIYQAQSLSLSQAVTLDESASHHCSRVLRMHVGDKLYVFNGQGGQYQAQIVAQANKKQLLVELQNYQSLQVESPLHIHLGQALVRGQKMDFVLQKSVELGVNAVTPLITERCAVKLPTERLQQRVVHWQTVAQGACEQSGREILPTVSAVTAISTWLANVKPDLGLVLDPHASQHLAEIALSPRRVALLIGPEGGLTAQECLQAQAAGFIGVRLGPRVLRTESAALVAISLLQYRWGDLLS